MNDNVFNVDHYDFSDQDSLLLDTNIWLYIYGPQAPGDKRVVAYSKALQKILHARSKIFLDVLVLSEFINRYARLEFDRFIGTEKKSNFKNYRKSTDFKPAAKAIADACRRIAKNCLPIESGFTSANMEAIKKDYEDKQPDFNDQILAELCKSKGLKLVTHDGDFEDQGLTLITANRRLLS